MNARVALLVSAALATTVSIVLIAAPTSPPRPDAPTTAGGFRGGRLVLLKAPAGKDGFITVRNGHLVYPNGERFRI